MSDTALSRQDRALIAWECEDLIRRFAKCVDDCAYEEIGRMFTPEGWFARPTDPTNPMHGPAVIVEKFKQRPAHIMTRHLVTNIVVTAESPARARATSYVTVFLATNGELPVACDQPAMIGAYEDVFAREGDQWRFVSRQGSVAMKFGG